MTLPTTGHDIIVVGASAGGVEALMRLVAGLPLDLAAAVFVVLHLPPDAQSSLPLILGRSGPLPVALAEDEQSIEHGRIYVGRPNRHLAIRRGRVALDAGPRENSARPAVDVLFRSAARAYGGRVVGVVLSGTLSDGSLGLAAIKMRGGVTVVQDPNEALFPGMPENALRTAQVDYCLSARDIPARLVELSRHTLEHAAINPGPHLELEPVMHAADEPDEQSSPKLPNAASGLSCPECHGSLWELDAGAGRIRYECRIGRSYGLEALLSEQGEAVEAALWSAIRALQERAAAFRRLGGFQGEPASAALERAELTEQHAEALHGLLRSLIDEGQVG